MTAFTALLSIKEVSQRTLCVYIALLQSASPSGAITESIDVIRRHYNKLFGARITSDDIKGEIDTLVEKGVIPSRGATYPFASKGGNSKNIDELIEKLESDVSDVRPDTENFPEQARIFAALKMANVIEIATKEKKVRVTAGGEVVVANGEQKKRVRKVWDYGLIGKLKNKYGAEEVIDTICEIHLHDGFRQFDDYDFKYRRQKCREYLFGALKGDIDKTDTPEKDMVY